MLQLGAGSVTCMETPAILERDGMNSKEDLLEVNKEPGCDLWVNLPLTAWRWAQNLLVVEGRSTARHQIRDMPVQARAPVSNAFAHRQTFPESFDIGGDRVGQAWACDARKLRQQLLPQLLQLLYI